MELLAMTTRRDVLRAFAAIGASVACRGQARGRRIEGSIVGGASGRGHQVRDGFRPRPDRWEEIPVAVVGAGVAGLSAAWRLEREGLRDFVVLELEDVAGGTARSGTGAVTSYPWGAHYVPVPNPGHAPLIRLLEEVGAVTGRDGSGRPIYAEEVLCREPQERIFYRGEWFEGLYPRIGASTDDTRQLRELEQDMRRWSAWRDAQGRRGFALPRAKGSDDPEIRALDGQSFAAYLDAHGWTSPRLRWFAEYACRDDFGASSAQTSAWAGIHYYAGRIEKAGGESAELLTWPEGNGRLVQHLAGVAGARLRTGALVTEVRAIRGGVELVYATAAGEVVGLRARTVVFALPRFLVSHLVAGTPSLASDFVYGSWMVANLTLRDRPDERGFPLCWDNVLYDSPSLGYVVATHQSGRDHGATVFTYYRPFPETDVRAARARLLATTWQEWVDQIMADLRPAHPDLASLLDRVDVYLWGHAMVRPRPGFLWSETLRRAAESIGPIHFAHTDLSGMALFEEAQYWGLHAAEAALDSIRHPHDRWLDFVVS
jgi:glycine/D-amino acid oxidase-like deaminating enzyme